MLLEFLINSAPSHSIGKAPFELFLGIMLVAPVDIRDGMNCIESVI